MNDSTVFKFFFMDFWRFAILILIIIAAILFLLVFVKTLKKKKKFKLIYIVMINVIVTAIINSIGFSFNWKVDNKFLFDDENGFACQGQSFLLFFTHTARETFVTLISVISFISFKFGDHFNIDKSKISLIIALLVGYLIPLIADIIYLNLKVYGFNDYYCFTSNENKNSSRICGVIHTVYILFLVAISIVFIIYLSIKTSRSNMEQKYRLWIDDNTEKYCINPILKKIIFFPVVQICANCIALTYRILNYIFDFKVDYLAKPAAAISSVSSISYTIIFAITNEIFTNFEREEEEESEDRESSESGIIELKV